MLKLKLQNFGHFMGRADSLEETLSKTESRRRRGWQRIIWLGGITDSMEISLTKLQEMAKDREIWCATIHGVAKSWTWLRDWKITVFRGGAIILPNSAGNFALEMWIWLNIKGNCSNIFPFCFFRWLHQMPMQKFCSIFLQILRVKRFSREISHKFCPCNLIDSQSFVIYGTLFLKASTWLSAFSPQKWVLHEERLYMVTASLRLL